MKPKPCPDCGSIDYRYGRNNFKYLNAIISRKGFVKLSGDLINSFNNYVIKGIPYTALLRCRVCESYVLPCPVCYEFLLSERYVDIGELFVCNKCNGKMTISETNDWEFGEFVKY